MTTLQRKAQNLYKWDIEKEGFFRDLREWVDEATLRIESLDSLLRNTAELARKAENTAMMLRPLG